MSEQEHREFTHRLAIIRRTNELPDSPVEETIKNLENLLAKHIVQDTLKRETLSPQEQIENLVSFFEEASRYLTIISWQAVLKEMPDISDHIISLWHLLAVNYINARARLTLSSVHQAKESYQKTIDLLSLLEG